MVGAPVFDGLFDGFGVGGVGGGVGGEVGEFVVGGEAESDDLFGVEAGVEEFAGEDVVAEVFLGADGAVLRFEGEDAAEDAKGHGEQDQDEEEGGAVEAGVVAPGLPEVHARSDPGGEEDGVEDLVEAGVEAGVIDEALVRHRLCALGGAEFVEGFGDVGGDIGGLAGLDLEAVHGPDWFAVTEKGEGGGGGGDAGTGEVFIAEVLDGFDIAAGEDGDGGIGAVGVLEGESDGGAGLGGGATADGVGDDEDGAMGGDGGVEFFGGPGLLDAVLGDVGAHRDEEGFRVCHRYSANKDAGRRGEDSAIKAAEVITADFEGVEEGLEAIPEADLGAFDVIPAYGDFEDAELVFLGDEEDFDVEAEAFDALTGGDGGSGGAAEEFEAALGVAVGEAGDETHDEVEELAAGFPEGGLADADEGAVEGAGADGAIGFPGLDGGPEFVEFVDGGGEVGVGEEDPVTLGFLHAVAHGIAFAAVAGVFEEADAGIAGGEIADDLGGLVAGAVVDDEDFGESGGEGIEEGGDGDEGGGQALLLVVGRDDDGERVQTANYNGGLPKESPVVPRTGIV